MTFSNTDGTAANSGCYVSQTRKVSASGCLTFISSGTSVPAADTLVWLSPEPDPRTKLNSSVWNTNYKCKAGLIIVSLKSCGKHFRRGRVNRETIEQHAHALFYRNIQDSALYYLSNDRTPFFTYMLILKEFICLLAYYISSF